MQEEKEIRQLSLKIADLFVSEGIKPQDALVVLRFAFKTIQEELDRLN